MPRKRAAEVQESLQELENLENHYCGMPPEPQLRTLRLLKEDPSRSMAEVARLVGTSERSVQRWWNEYRQGGIDAVLRVGAPETPKRIGPKELDELRQVLQRQEIDSLEEMQEVILDRFGMRYSLKAVSNLLQRQLKAQRTWIIPERTGSRSGEQSDTMTSGIPATLLQFLNRLPLSLDTPEWIGGFSEALRGVLGDVDRVSININGNCDLRNPEEYSNDLFITQHIVPTAKRSRLRVVTSQRMEQRPADLLLDSLRQQGFPLAQYHPPIAYDYFLAGTAYVGTIFLWRERPKKPVSQKTQEFMQAWEPFLLFMLTNCIVRQQCLDPVDRTFNNALKSAGVETNLTKREREILILHLFGLTHEAITKSLQITSDTVRKHMKAIYRKTRTRTSKELLAKYFTPLQGRLPEATEKKELQV